MASRTVRAGLDAVSAGAVACIVLACVAASPALAQDPSLQQTQPALPPSAFPASAAPQLPSTNIDQSQPLYLQGDQLIYDTDGNRVIAKGNVEIYYNNYILTAEEVIYDQSAGTLTAVGNVELKEPNGNIVRADRYTLTDDFRDGFVQSLSVVAADDTRIVAERAVRRGGTTTVFTDGKFTPCKTEGAMPPLWCISAKRVIHDQQAATITYQDAAFEVLGQPILYLPFFQHADPSVKRKSGFLPPRYAASEDLGLLIEVPYYLAIAPNLDFLFHPAATTRQGILWQGDFRHRIGNGQYTVNFAAIDQDGDELDGISSALREERDGLRGSIETRGLFSLSSWWKAGWDVTLETDDTFRRFYKLDNILVEDRVNQVFLRGQSDRNYFEANLYQFGGLLFNDTPRAESRVHPIIDYNYIVDQPVVGGEVSVNTNVLSFSRDDFRGDNTSQQDITRVTSEVKWRRKLIDDIGISYTPFAELRGDIYQFNNIIDPFDASTTSSDTVVRGVGAGGVTVSYPWIAGNDTGSHTVEPIGQVIARQGSVEQRSLPNEDARSLVFDDTNLFETNKFSGYDRIETGTRANVGVQYTFQANTGGYARLLAGQSFHLSGDNPYDNPGRDFSQSTSITDPNAPFLNAPNSGLETDRSDYVLGAYIAPTNAFRLITQNRFDEDDLTLRRSDTTAAVSIGPLSAQATYTYVDASPEFGVDESQSDIFGDVALRLTEYWSIGGSIRYDLDDSNTLTDAIRVRYADECFVLTASYAETFIDDPIREIEPDRTVFLRFEFKHLGEFGYKTDALDFVFGDNQEPGAG